MKCRSYVVVGAALKGFPEEVYRFREQAAKIREDIDLGNQETFAELITALCQLTDSEVEEVGDGQNYLGCKRVTGAIDAIVSLPG